MSDLASLLEKVRSAVSRVPKNLTEHKLRQRSKSMLDAGHADDADLDIEAADAISALERELEEARSLNEQLRGETYLSSAEAAEFHRDNAVTMWDAERARATAAEAKAARIGEALEQLVPFAKWAIRESAFSGHELDGGEVQEKALAHCLIVRTVYDPQQHGPSDVASAGDEWFEFSSILAEPQP